MNVGSISSPPAAPAIQGPAAKPAAKDADGDHDGTTAAKAPAAPAPTVNTNGQTIGQLIHATA